MSCFYLLLQNQTFYHAIIIAIKNKKSIAGNEKTSFWPVIRDPHELSAQISTGLMCDTLEIRDGKGLGTKGKRLKHVDGRNSRTGWANPLACCTWRQ